MLLSQEQNRSKSKLAIHSWVAAVRTIIGFGADMALLNRSFKVHVAEEVPKQKKQGNIWTMSATATGTGEPGLICCEPYHVVRSDV
jgi:hypothetical protein